MRSRVGAFVFVGAIGFVVQVTALLALRALDVPLPVATAMAVEAAVLHNFMWHERWTWRDRNSEGHWVGRLWRFHSSAAVISLGVNVVVTWMLVRLFHLPAVAANTLAVGLAGLANFAAADRWVFARRTSMAALVCMLSAASALAEPSPAALDAWRAYVQTAEAQRRLLRQADCVADADPVGTSVKVPAGTIFRWSSCTVVRGITVPAVLRTLIDSGTPPPQEDVLESRLLARDGNRLRVYLRLQRRALVTVSYDTEHEMTFEHISDTLAVSRSVATSIRQVDGGDLGFLWRLNSYWAYQQAGADVRVELVSLSLSRDVPLLLRPVAAPMIASVGRESLTRTLSSLRKFLERPSTGRQSFTVRSADAP